MIEVIKPNGEPVGIARKSRGDRVTSVFLLSFSFTSNRWWGTSLYLVFAKISMREDERNPRVWRYNPGLQHRASGAWNCNRPNGWIEARLYVLHGAMKINLERDKIGVTKTRKFTRKLSIELCRFAMILFIGILEGERIKNSIQWVLEMTLLNLS